MSRRKEERKEVKIWKPLWDSRKLLGSKANHMIMTERNVCPSSQEKTQDGFVRTEWEEGTVLGDAGRIFH